MHMVTFRLRFVNIRLRIRNVWKTIAEGIKYKLINKATGRDLVPIDGVETFFFPRFETTALRESQFIEKRKKESRLNDCVLPIYNLHIGNKNVW